MASWNLQAVKPHLNGANNASKSKSNIAGKSLLNIGKESGTKHQSNVKGMQGGALSMSVEMPEVIEPQDIEYACACIHRPQDEIMWSVGKVLQDFHKRNQFNDALIKVSNGQVMAHRHVLSASSPWLHNFLHSSAKRTLQVGYQQLTEIRMDEKLDAAAVTQIVDYMYTARCRLNYFNVYAVYQAATYLRMATLIAACQRLLSVLMSDQNIAIMLEVGNGYHNN
jgi:BTB/POZ domain